MSLNHLNDQVSGQYQTTDDSIVTGYSYPILQNSTNKITLNVMATDADTGDVSGTELKFMVKRGTGSCSVVGDITNSMQLVGDTEMLSVSASPVANGASLDVHVTGLSATTINWDVYIQARVEYQN